MAYVGPPYWSGPCILAVASGRSYMQRIEPKCSDPTCAELKCTGPTTGLIGKTYCNRPTACQTPEPKARDAETGPIGGPKKHNVFLIKYNVC